METADARASTPLFPELHIKRQCSASSTLTLYTGRAISTFCKIYYLGSKRMPAAFKSHLILWAFILSSLLSLPGFALTGFMDTLSSSFTIEVNGKPIANVGNDAEDRIQAKTGEEAAVFTLKDGRLQSGDWILGRAVIEDRSFLPKQVLWFKSNEGSNRRVQRVAASENGDSYQLKFANAYLVAKDGNIFADLQGSDEHTSVILKK